MLTTNMKQFSATITVTLPDANKVDIGVNLLDINAEFNCPVCDFIGDESKISLLSFSDHFARHYVENNRAEKIDNFIEEEKGRNKTAITTQEIAQYDYYLRSAERFHRNGPPPLMPVVNYPELTEEDLLKLAIEESLKDAEETKVQPVSEDTQTNPPPELSADTPTYQPRKKKTPTAQ